MMRITIAVITLMPSATLDLRSDHLELGQTGSAPSSVPPNYKRVYVVDEVVSDSRLLVRLKTVRIEEGANQEEASRSLPDFLFLLKMDTTGIPNPKAKPVPPPPVPPSKGINKALPALPKTVGPTILNMAGTYEIVGRERIGPRTFWVLQRVN